MFRTYNIREGEELALVCRDRNNRNNNRISWQRKVRNNFLLITVRIRSF